MSGGRIAGEGLKTKVEVEKNKKRKGGELVLKFELLGWKKEDSNQGKKDQGTAPPFKKKSIKRHEKVWIMKKKRRTGRRVLESYIEGEANGRRS